MCDFKQSVGAEGEEEGEGQPKVQMTVRHALQAQMSWSSRKCPASRTLSGSFEPSAVISSGTILSTLMKNISLMMSDKKKKRINKMY